MSLRDALNAKCRDCIYDPKAGGTWREQTAACPASSCPLWPYRPAATSGPLANPPRDPAAVTPGWRAALVGCLKTGNPSPEVSLGAV